MKERGKVFSTAFPLFFIFVKNNSSRDTSIFIPFLNPNNPSTELIGKFQISDQYETSEE
jgi:hypothetical protein